MVTSRKPSKRPSMFEVAKLAGVSHQTVSRVINDSPDVSDATRARVQAAIDQLGYRPSNSARALASRRSRTIGLIAGGLKFFGPISSISSIESMLPGVVFVVLFVATSNLNLTIADRKSTRLNSSH